MATCPRCGEFLDERHRCDQIWPRRLRLLASLGRSAAIGAVVGAFVLVSIDGRAAWYSVVLSGAVGVVIDLAVHVR